MWAGLPEVPPFHPQSPEITSQESPQPWQQHRREQSTARGSLSPQTDLCSACRLGARMEPGLTLCLYHALGMTGLLWQILLQMSPKFC